jgi:hypothetical protein
MSTELAKIATEPISLVEMLQQVMDRPGFDVAKADAFYGFVERMKKDDAEKKFGDAIEDLFIRIAGMQFVKDGKIPKGKPDANGKYTSFVPFMTYKQVWSKVGPHFRELGLTARFTSKITEGKAGVTWTLHVRHRAGHEETSDKWCPPLDSGQMNNLQQYGGADSYTQRYLLTKYLNIVEDGEDNDGAQPPSFITEQQLMKLEDMISSLDMNETERAGFLRYMAVAKISSIPARSFNMAFEALKTKQRMRKEGK